MSRKELIVLFVLLFWMCNCSVKGFDESWDGYIDNVIGHCSGHCDRVCIIGLDGKPWTTNVHAYALKLDVSERKEIAEAFKSKDFTSFASNGIFIEGLKYQCMRGEGDLVLGKKKDHGFVTLQSTETAIVIAHGSEGSNQIIVNSAVNSFATYLKNMGM